MAIVVNARHQGEHVDAMLRRFTKAIQNDNLARDIARHSYFKSSGERRRDKRHRAKKRQASGA